MRARSLACIACAALSGCGADAPDDEVNPVLGTTIPRVVSLQEALSTSDIPTLDPHTMKDAEISKVIGEGPFCAFRYVSDGHPVLAWRPQPAEAAAPAVVKLNGMLVQLHRNVDASATQFVADDLRMTLMSSDANERDRADSGPREAQLLFEIGHRLRVGYGGYMVCPRSATEP